MYARGSVTRGEKGLPLDLYFCASVTLRYGADGTKGYGAWAGVPVPAVRTNRPSHALRLKALRARIRLAIIPVTVSAILTRRPFGVDRIGLHRLDLCGLLRHKQHDCSGLGRLRLQLARQLGHKAQ